MTKKEAFIDFVTKMIVEYGDLMSDEAYEYWTALRDKPEKVKPLVTENGKRILVFLRDNTENKESYFGKEVAEGLGISSKAIAGAMRKLVETGYVEKLGQDPAAYSLTEKGKNEEI